MTEAAAEKKARTVLRRLERIYPLDEHPGRLPLVDELVCTILSQNTTDRARDQAFERLREGYPTWDAVRDAPVEEVEVAIRVCGLANQKAPRIQAALRAATERSGREVSLDFLKEMEPQEAREWLMGLDGVGIKTASIVLLFALDMPALPVDTHVHRVAGRLGLIEPGTSAEKAHYALEEIVPVTEYLPFHMALIRHGREVCRARRPRCDACTLTDLCDWFAAHPEERPAG